MQPDEGKIAVANTGHDRAGGKSARPPRGPQPKMRARELVAAERAARKRAEARRRILLAIASITAVAGFVVALVGGNLTSAPARLVASESQAPSAVVRQVTTVPGAVMARVSPGQVVTPLQTVKTSDPLLTIGGKPAIVFVSEESCPFCAAERWSLETDRRRPEQRHPTQPSQPRQARPHMLSAQRTASTGRPTDGGWPVVSEA